MPTCQICGKELKMLNANHLSAHGITLQQYIETYGDPNKSTLGAPRRTTDAKAIKEKIATKPKSAPKQSKTIEELYELEHSIVVPRNFYWVDKNNPEILDIVIDLIKRYKKVAVDTETTGLDPFVDKVTHIILTPYDPERRYNIIVPLYHEDRDGNPLPDLLPKDYVVSKIKPVLEDPEIRTVWFNLYFDDIMLYNSLGIDIPNIVPPRFLPYYDPEVGKMVMPKWRKGVDVWDGGWDGSVAAHVLQENEPSHKLKDLYKKYLHNQETDPDIKELSVETYEEQFGKIKFYRVPKKVATCYGCKDGHMTRKLEEFQRPYIDTTGNLDSLLYTIEFPQIKVLVNMRKRGINLDMDFAYKLGQELNEKREGARKKLVATLGNINFNSPAQVSKALFKDLGLPDLQEGSTKASVLQELAEFGYEIAEDLLDYKKTEKLISTYIDGAPDVINDKTGKVHAQFNQSGARTGRYSSSKPNLQNIPAKFGRMRMMFTGDPDEVLIGGDYSQIEPRLTAHTCGDEHMIQAYIENKDLYSTLAARVFTLLANRMCEELNERISDKRAAYAQFDYNDPVKGMVPFKQQLYHDGFVYLDNETGYFESKPLAPEDCYDGTIYRKTMKTLWLGMNYGMTSYGLSSRLKISEADANEILNMFYGAFPKLKQAMDECKKFCPKNGYIETEWGRKSRLPDI